MTLPCEQLVQSMGPQARAASHGPVCGAMEQLWYFPVCSALLLWLMWFTPCWWKARALGVLHIREAILQSSSGDCSAPAGLVCVLRVGQEGPEATSVLAATAVTQSVGLGAPTCCWDRSLWPTEGRWEVLSAWEVFTLIFFLSLNRKEFFEGCKAINADSIDGICARFPGLLHEAKQEDKFKDLYRFTFQFGLDSEEGQRSLHREIAIALWKLVFTQNKPPILDQWLHFLVENPSGIKGISRDTWNMFLNFTQVIGPDLSNYSEDEAWPSLFDTFVEWEMERRKKEEETKCITSLDTEGLCTEEQT